MQTHLFRRGSHYHVRRRLPAPIAQSTGRSHVVRSLRTTDPRRAAQEVRRVSYLLDQWFVHMTITGRRPSADELKRVLARVFNVLLERDEIERASRPAVDLKDAELELYETVWVNDGSDPNAPDEFQVLRSTLEAEHEVELWRDRLARNDTTTIAPEVDDALACEGIAFSKNDPLYRVLLHQSTRAALRAAERIVDRENGIFEEDDFGRFFDGVNAAISASVPPLPPPPVQAAKPAAPMISVAFEDMRSAKTGKDWGSGGKDHRDSKNAIRAFLDLMGDRPLDQVTSADAFKFRTALGRVPSNNGKGVFANLSYQDAIRRADEIEKGTFRPKPDAEPSPAKEVKRLAAKTINKYLTYFTSLYNYKPVVDLSVGKPFGGSLIDKRVQARQNSRLAWSQTALEMLFKSPLYQGCAGRAPRQRALSGAEIIQDALYWAPLLTLYGGLRLEELAGLMADEIVERDGMWCVEIKPNSERHDTKSASATRTIPLHPVLLDLGFPSYAKGRKRKIFPECVPGGAEKRLGYKLSRDITAYRRKIGLTDPSIDHHAFRHNFAGALHNAGVSTAIAAYLLGHSPAGVTTYDYHMRGASDRFDLSTLRLSVARVQHGGLEALLLAGRTRSDDHENS